MVRMFGMELWFVLAVISALASGLAAFTNKIAVHNGYRGDLLILQSTLIPLPFFAVALFFINLSATTLFALLLGILAGVSASLSGVLKIQSLQNIDATIFFPLFKIVAPALTIAIGTVYFAESFTVYEWLGLLVSLFVPLLLISKIENTRQQNLLRGLLFLLAAGFVAAVTAGLYKLGSEQASRILFLFMSTLGVFAGSLGMTLFKNGYGKMMQKIMDDTSLPMLITGMARGVLLTISAAASVYAYVHGGTLGVVYTINSLYILIPIVLSIIFYNEHWNLRKVIAIVLSIAALGLLK